MLDVRYFFCTFNVYMNLLTFLQLIGHNVGGLLTDSKLCLTENCTLNFDW